MPQTPFLIKVEAYNFIKKEALAQVFSCKFCEISKNTFLIAQHTSGAASIIVTKTSDFTLYLTKKLYFPETGVQRCYIKKVFFKISQNS